MDIEFIKSSLALDLIPDATIHPNLTDGSLRDYQDKEASDSHTTLTMPKLDAIIKWELCMDMKTSDSSSRMKKFFIEYYSLLHLHGPSWIVKENDMVAIAHILGAVKPQKIEARLDSDWAFSHHKLKKGVQGFSSTRRK